MPLANGIILSPDEKTLYVTNGTVVFAFDVKPDGSPANQQEFSIIAIPTIAQGYTGRAK